MVILVALLDLKGNVSPPSLYVRRGPDGKRTLTIVLCNFGGYVIAVLCFQLLGGICVCTLHY